MKLLIGYGNELRGDDGLGPRIARQIDAWRLPDVMVRVAHQLTPEMTDLLMQADATLFIDAAKGLKEIRLDRLEPRDHGPHMHALDPASLLGLTRLIHGVWPAAWVLKVPGRSFDYGMSLSEDARRSIDDVLMWARTWLLADAATEAETPSWQEVGVAG